MSSSIISQRRRAISKLLCTFTLSRSMGGGPRTFPGGVNKWKWKRMHEKRARDKEKRLLEQEKQLYQARIRSHIRSKLASKPDLSTATHEPITPNDHVKALANRFMKDGAEDLWNKDDGPLRPPPSRSASIGSPLDLRKLIPEARNGNSKNTAINFAQTRSYSVQIRKSFQTNEEGSRAGSEGNSAMPVVRNSYSNSRNTGNRNVDDYISNKKLTPKGRRKFWRNDSSSRESESDLESGGESDSENYSTIGRDVKKMGSSASLGKYDMKRERRVMPGSYDDGSDFSEQVELIRYELNKKKLAENEGQKVEGEQETILSQRRFDECGISPLTVKALSLAGYIHMTRVQEATLSICLEGKDALVKAKTGTGKSAAFLF